MVLLSRSHVLERHGQDAIQVLTASWPAMRVSAKTFFLSSDQGVILALETACVHEVALRGLQKFSVLRLRKWPFEDKSLGFFSAFHSHAATGSAA